jgi:hypothetical protein
MTGENLIPRPRPPPSRGKTKGEKEENNEATDIELFFTRIY